MNNPPYTLLMNCKEIVLDHPDSQAFIDVCRLTAAIDRSASGLFSLLTSSDTSVFRETNGTGGVQPAGGMSRIQLCSETAAGV